MIQKLLAYSKNFPGWSTKRKLFVLESDDWGSTRMPSEAVRKELEQAGINLGKSNFMKVDTLASAKDFELLYETLGSVKDKHGNHAVISPFVNVANADFDRMINSGYDQYYFEPFTETLKRYYSTDVFKYWQEGIKSNLFVPEYHGREHFNVPLLMRFLKQGHKSLTDAFKRGVLHIPIPELKTEGVSSLAPAYFYDNQADLAYLKQSLVEGAELFEKIFGFPAASFVPPNGIFNNELELAVAKTKIKAIVVDRTRNEPDGKGGVTKQNFQYKFGKFNPDGKLYYIRNGKFEPVQKDYQRATTLLDIGAAFAMGKPAIISSHRLNYIGGISESHRDAGLKELKALLQQIVKKWPDVEFVSSAELVKIMLESLQKKCN